MNHEEDIYHQVGENYRGIFYNQEEPEERYFEHGAHFQYNDLCRRLEKVKKAFTGSRRDEHREAEKETNCHSLGKLYNKQYISPSSIPYKHKPE